MRRRIFIAVNLPKEIKKELLSFQDKWQELPARWTKEDNIHITLIFLGYVKDEDLPAVCNAAKEAAAGRKLFPISLKKIIYGPPKKIPPRMVWAVGEKSNELSRLRNDLNKSLNEAGISFKSEDREFALHLTLARIKTWEWRKIEPEERPEINEEIDLSFEAQSIEVMESELKRAGPEYFVIQSFPFGK